MGKVNVIIVDATGNKEQKVGLPDDIKCGIIMVKLVEKIKLPSVGPDGNPISYKFIHKVTGRQLLEAQTLAEAGIKDGDVLRLQPEITAGAICRNCGNTENDDQSYCSRCGTALLKTQASGFVNMDPTNSAYNTYNQNAYSNSKVSQFNSNFSKNLKRKPSFFLGNISGALSILFGILMLAMDDGYFEASEKYGGDAYTGIQNAAAQAANNIVDLANIAKTGFGFLLIAFGLFQIIYFVSKSKSMSDNQ